ncbi:MAG: hypothetical protein L0207_07170 [Chlamydiae bacterium]|nr:hypothetical protein [Chlamydiota bacterium]
MNIILFGFQYSGKTHFGRLLSQRLHLPFIDLDQKIEENYQKQFSLALSCRQIALEKGGVFFRKLEKETLFSLKKVRNSVISLGGGTVLDEENLRFILGFGKLIYLNANKEVIKKRILGGQLPAYLDPDDPEESFENLYYERKKIYEMIQAKRIDLHAKSESEILEELEKL